MQSKLTTSCLKRQHLLSLPKTNKYFSFLKLNNNKYQGFENNSFNKNYFRVNLFKNQQLFESENDQKIYEETKNKLLRKQSNKVALMIAIGTFTILVSLSLKGNFKAKESLENEIFLIFEKDLKNLNTLDEEETIKLLSDLQIIEKSVIQGLSPKVFERKFLQNLFYCIQSKDLEIRNQSINTMLSIMKCCPPRLVQEVYEVSKQFNLIQIVLNQLKFAANNPTSVNISFEELTALASSGDVKSVNFSPNYSNNPTTNATVSLIMEDRKLLALLIEFFANKHISRSIVENQQKGYISYLERLLEKGTPLERHIALLTVNGLSLSCSKNGIDLKQKCSNLIKAIERSINIDKSESYKNYATDLLKNLGKPLIQQMDKTSLSIYGVATTICYLYNGGMQPIPRAGLLALFYYYISTQQTKVDEYFISEFESRNNSVPLEEYVKNWNKTLLSIYATNAAIYTSVGAIAGYPFVVAGYYLISGRTDYVTSISFSSNGEFDASYAIQDDDWSNEYIFKGVINDLKQVTDNEWEVNATLAEVIGETGARWGCGGTSSTKENIPFNTKLKVEKEELILWWSFSKPSEGQFHNGEWFKLSKQ
ncbi:hypothetical protein ABK040_005471 [Willaertia magna]